MNATEAFSHREEELLGQLGCARDVQEAVMACTMALEQTACELAQDEQDEHARQRQQAVMALARRAPQLLRAASARGELVMEQAGAPKPPSAEHIKKEKLRKGARAAGALLLAALALYELIDGQALFAAVQLIGGALLMMPQRETERAAEPGLQARGIAGVEAQGAVCALRELCQAVDVCVSDLALLSREDGMAMLSGTADEAMLDLLGALMEAKASGRSELAMRSLAQAEQYLHRLGIEVVSYDAEHAQLFDVLPTLGEARTIRPAMIQQGRVVRRGVAAMQQEGGWSR